MRPSELDRVEASHLVAGCGLPHPGGIHTTLSGDTPDFISYIGLSVLWFDVSFFASL